MKKENWKEISVTDLHFSPAWKCPAQDDLEKVNRDPISTKNPFLPNMSCVVHTSSYIFILLSELNTLQQC